MLELTNVSKSFSDTVAVDSVSFQVQTGEACFLLGASGCGKTTVLRLIAGLESADAGKITLNGQDISHTPPSARKIGFVFQQYALWPHLTVQQHVSFGLQVQKQSGTRIHQRTKDVLEMTGLGKLAHRKPSELSGGQQQRVALARALAPNPEVLLLDEPFSNLDSALKQELTAELRRLQRELNLTYIFVTHDRQEALSLADNVVLLKNGRVVTAGPPKQLFFSPTSRYAYTFLGESVFLPPQAERAEFTRPEFCQLIKPAEHSRAYPGQVQQQIFLGASSRVSVALPTGATITALVPAETVNGLSPGTTTTVYVKESDIASPPDD